MVLTHSSAIVEGTQVTPPVSAEGTTKPLSLQRETSLLTAAVSILPTPVAAHRGRQLTALSVLHCQGSLKRQMESDILRETPLIVSLRETQLCWGSRWEPSKQEQTGTHSSSKATVFTGDIQVHCTWVSHQGLCSKFPSSHSTCFLSLHYF